MLLPLDLIWCRFLHACQLLCISPHLPCHTCHLEYAVGTRIIHWCSGHTHLFSTVLNFPRNVPSNELPRTEISPLTSYLLLFSYSIKHIQIYTICRKTDDCTLHIIKKRKPKKISFVNCRHSPPSIVSEIQIQQKLYLKITRLPNTQQIFLLLYMCNTNSLFFSNPLLNNP